MAIEVRADDVTARDGDGASWSAFFSYGFRPFFLGAAVWAALAMALWLTWIAIHAAGGALTWMTIADAPHVWHAHEMVYGFAAAAVAGFLLTAVPNWTGALPLTGRPLEVLFALWLVGRVAMAMSGLLPYPLVAAADIAFLPVLAGFAARQLMVKPQRKNMVFLAMIAVMAGANVAYHSIEAGIAAGDPLAPVRVALLTLVMMVVVIGGRIVPSFTHNWLHLQAVPGAMPRRNARLDLLSVASVAGLVLVSALPLADAWIGAMAVVAGLANAARFAGWRGLATWRSPIVVVLHVGYAWIVAGLLLLAAAKLGGPISAASAMHALGTGGVGTMILAVMSRASLGHTGRPLIAHPAIAAAYALVSLAALLRVFGPVLYPQAYNALMLAAGLAWITAFAVFALIYLPALTSPRVHQRTSGS
jgi:uncharacterized protein involved in response to NO